MRSKLSGNSRPIFAGT